MRHAQVASAVFVLALSLAVSGCASNGPAMPQVAVMPGKGKSYEAFQRDDAYCQSSGQAAIGGQSPGAAANGAALGSAVLGTGLGAASGALIGAAAGNRPGTGAAIGGGAGMLLGSAVGSGQSAQAGGAIQSRYDTVYAQCMAAKGHKVGASTMATPVFVAPAPVYSAAPYPYY